MNDSAFSLEAYNLALQLPKKELPYRGFKSTINLEKSLQAHSQLCTTMIAQIQTIVLISFAFFVFLVVLFV